jgi:hypothetical protein
MYPGSSLCFERTTTVEAAAPEGWVVFDPYTHLTYCPACWASIESGNDSPNSRASERSLNPRSCKSESVGSAPVEEGTG